jgi:cyclopropane fatty-acyl-phospholipid synthase-like methyltransferase
MGEDFHFGYFESEDMDLFQATDALIEKMLGLCDISEDSRVLDVGCGIGGPAFYIHEKTRCSIDGISTSERGVEAANAISREKGYRNVRFKVTDGLSNGFPDNTFDVAWVMETSHLIKNKRQLLMECYRVLKKGGTFVLCDLISLIFKPFYFEMPYLFRHYKKFLQLIEAFGPSQLNRLGIYCDFLIEAGFHEVAALDISQQTIPTMRCWIDNARSFIDSEDADLSQDYAQQFITGCEILEWFFREGAFGYGMIRATK